MTKERSDATPRAWQRMLSGRRLNLLDPSPLDVEISDIAHGLARVARWNGQTIGDHAFSVAEHSMVVEDIALTLKPDLSPDWRLAVLLHDAPEYVIGDMISPFKAVMGGAYKAVEARLQAAIHLRFGLPADIPQTIKKLAKRADLICAYFEAIELAGFDENEAAKIFGKPRAFQEHLGPGHRLKLTPLTTADAQRLFLKRFVEIEDLRASSKNTCRKTA
ncbi:metal dependent phosphohydrolase [Roseibium hamelinense]|uniref:Metal dependent phosphohydrolase n=1 Tax=Roseibium hamelinense TaxID=150831 RepID=A0A562T3W6_9HYPH|nr:HD family hydrolase [Roseibium hamelinense]MTI42289.1 HD family hydrolase [Roseibium hamelinense]TWI87690.1 metal dependent phosphohydrolase [Roseibium hamelinense]